MNNKSLIEALGVTPAEFAAIQAVKGLHFAGDPRAKANDSLPNIFSTSNGALLQSFLMGYSGEAVRQIVSPMVSERIAEQERLCDWADTMGIVPQIEMTGTVETYGDENTGGTAGNNLNYLERDHYRMQTHTRIGDLEQQQAMKSKFNALAEKQIAAAHILRQENNRINFYGVEGLKTYGFINDPNLNPSITPNVKAGGGIAWNSASTFDEIWSDILAIIDQMSKQLKRSVLRSEERYVLMMSPDKFNLLGRINAIGNKTILVVFEETYPNIRIETAPEMADLLQLRLERIDGQRVTVLGISDSYHEYPVFIKSSVSTQKKASGTLGCFTRLPVGVVTMEGI